MENNKTPGIERAYLVNQLSTLRKQLVIELTEKKGLNLFLYLT